MLVCPLPSHHPSTVMSSRPKRSRCYPVTIPGSEVGPLPKRARRSRRLRGEMVVLPPTMKGNIQHSVEKNLDTFETESTPVSPMSIEYGVGGVYSDSSELVCPPCSGQIPGGFDVFSSTPELSDSSLEFSSMLTPVSLMLERNPNLPRLPRESPQSTPSPLLETQMVSRPCRQQHPGEESTTRRVELPISQAFFHGKRMASLNASACVSAMMESRARPQKTKDSQNHSKKKTKAPPSKSPKDVPIAAKVTKTSQFEHSELLEPQEPCKTYDAIMAAPTLEGEGYGAVSSTAGLRIPKCLLIVTQQHSDPKEKVEFDATKFNNQGLLYNGGTIHPQTRFFLTSEGQVPSRILPFLVPARSEALKDAMSLASQQDKFHPKKPQAGKVSAKDCAYIYIRCPFVWSILAAMR